MKQRTGSVGASKMGSRKEGAGPVFRWAPRAKGFGLEQRRPGRGDRGRERGDVAFASCFSWKVGSYAGGGQGKFDVKSGSVDGAGGGERREGSLGRSVSEPRGKRGKALRESVKADGEIGGLAGALGDAKGQGRRSNCAGRGRGCSPAPGGCRSGLRSARRCGRPSFRSGGSGR